MKTSNSTSQVVITMSAEQAAQSLASMKEARQRWLDSQPVASQSVVELPMKRSLFQMILKAIAF